MARVVGLERAALEGPRLATLPRACVPRLRVGCASGCNDEPSVSAASAGWVAVAPAKRGQMTGLGLDPPRCPDVRTVTASPP